MWAFTARGDSHCATHTCKLKQEDMRPWMNEVLSVEVYFSTFFCVVQKRNAKYFCPGELRSNAAKYKPLKQYGKSEGALWEERQWEFKMQQTTHNRRERENEEHKKQRYQRENKRKQNQKKET